MSYRALRRLALPVLLLPLYHTCQNACLWDHYNIISVRIEMRILGPHHLVTSFTQVEWEFWTNSNDMCGAVCDVQREFIKVNITA